MRTADSSHTPRADIRKPATLWMTGLSGAGKTTLAGHLKERLERCGQRCAILDGDTLRQGLSSDLGYGREDRKEQVRRVAHVARILNDAGVDVIVALVSPYRADRQLARTIIGPANMLEVWVCASLETCRARDPKGLYRQVEDGLLSGMTGITAPYEPPGEEALPVDTGRFDVQTCTARILDALHTHLSSRPDLDNAQC